MLGRILKSKQSPLLSTEATISKYYCLKKSQWLILSTNHAPDNAIYFSLILVLLALIQAPSVHLTDIYEKKRNEH